MLQKIYQVITEHLIFLKFIILNLNYTFNDKLFKTEIVLYYIQYPTKVRRFCIDLFWQSDKRLLFFLHYSHLHSFVLFNWFALYLPCALCHFTLSISFYFSTMSSFVYLYSLYVHMVKLYLSVFERLLSVFNVNCMHQGSEGNFNSLYVCMYCTCGRIDNKARLDLIAVELIHITNQKSGRAARDPEERAERIVCF